MRRNKATFEPKRYIVWGGLIVRRLENTADRHADNIADWEFLAADVEGVECVGAVGAVL